MAAKKARGENGYYSFLMSERRAHPQLSQEDLVLHCSKLWRNGGYDSYGRPLEQLLTREAQEQAEAGSMEQEVRGWVEQTCKEGTLGQQQFYIIHANVFCLTEEKGVVPAELCLARVSLAGGVEEMLHFMIAHGPLPLGYRADCLATSAKTHKIPLDLEGADADYPGILERIALFLGSKMKSPPLYLLPKAKHQTRLVLDWLQEKSASGQVARLQLYSLPCLLFHLVRVGREVQGGLQVPTINIAEVQLDRDVFLYTPGVACTWHEEHDEPVHCSVGIVRRWAYILLHLSCPRHHLDLLPGSHLPSAPPRSTAGSSKTSVSSSTDRAKEGRKKNRPLRKPSAPELWLPSSWGAPCPVEPAPSLPDSLPCSGHPFLSVSLASHSDSFRVLPLACPKESFISLPASVQEEEDDWEWEGLRSWGALPSLGTNTSLGTSFNASLNFSRS